MSVKGRKKEEKYCGECCWFYAEDTDGYGLCPLALMETKRCDEPCTISEKYVSKEDMRHHMKVLLTVKYWFEGNHRHGISPHELHEAMAFAYKYMKVFSKL